MATKRLAIAALDLYATCHLALNGEFLFILTAVESCLRQAKRILMSARWQFSTAFKINFVANLKVHHKAAIKPMSKS